MSDDKMKSFIRDGIHMVDPSTGVLEVFNMMKSKKVRHIPVIEKGEAVGIISDRDVQFINHAGDAFQLKAADVMTTEPYSVDSMTSIPHVVNVMAQKKINSVLIHDVNHKIVGIFTSTDALQILSDHYKSLEEEKEE
jgi:acetoin utilization protein AcuB